jgi:Flp pilus assembly protein TadG
MSAPQLIAARTAPLANLRKFVRAEEGATLTEFGLISPVLFLLLFGAFDLGHTLYMKTVLEGAVQKAARDASLESAAGNDASVRSAIDSAVEDQLRPLNGSATITFDRRFYRTFTEAEAAEAEEFTDSASGTFANGICDNGETFTDNNNNGVWDGDGGDSINRAGARDNVVYTVTIEYPRLFPLHTFIDVPDTMSLTASTVLANQPYGDQDSYDAPTTGTCT